MLSENQTEAEKMLLLQLHRKKQIFFFFLERFKDFLLNLTFHQRKQYKIPCLNYWWVFLYIGQQKGFCYQANFIATASLP